MIARPNKMYVQLTLFCNMSCRHCCYDCGPSKKNTFMTMETFEAALKVEPDTYLNIGGGEPTCHPLFWDFMAVALRARGRKRVWLATNGKASQHAILLASMIERGEINGCLSQDRWHEPIRQDVVDLFRRLNEKSAKSVIRDVSRGRGPIKSGRWKGNHRMVCNGDDLPFVQWDGQVRQCACMDSPIIGNVFDGYKPMFLDDPNKEAWACGVGRESTH